MDSSSELREAPAIKTGVEDTFHYEITTQCALCGSCESECPAGAITEAGESFLVDKRACIDCGTCAMVCPVGAARSIPFIRASLDPAAVRSKDACYFNAGCAQSLYKPETAAQLFSLLKEHYPQLHLHERCCHHDPQLPAGSVIINCCAGCDRRFRSLYAGINTLSLWELLDATPQLNLPDFCGRQVSVHDSCGYRHKPQVHRAIRSLLRKMNLEIVEAQFSGTSSVCCGDKLYGLLEDEQVEQRIAERARQFPCAEVVVTCIGCMRALSSAGKKPCYLPELLLGRMTEPLSESLFEYHSKLERYIAGH